jgi:hypothetical protein
MRALLIPAKPMSLFRANFKKRFVSGHDFSRAVNEANDEGFSPCGSLSLSVWLGDHSAFQSTGRTLPLQESIAPEVHLFHALWRTQSRKEMTSRHMPSKAYLSGLSRHARSLLRHG